MAGRSEQRPTARTGRGDEPRLRRLAAWYHRHGFRHRDQPHEYRADGATLRRAAAGHVQEPSRP